MNLEVTCPSRIAASHFGVDPSHTSSAASESIVLTALAEERRAEPARLSPIVPEIGARNSEGFEHLSSKFSTSFHNLRIQNA
ncbi:hypothetical protein M758_10G152400 [Ceratodon purpureus]|nr:hypothetical protein M758_10G152400 [Ceratodon purpureus]